MEGLKKIASAKQFASWLRLSPNNKISGGKVLSSHVPKGSNRLKKETLTERFMGKVQKSLAMDGYSMKDVELLIEN